MNRETALGVMVVSLGALAVSRMVPARAPPTFVPCAAERVGLSRGVAACGGAGALTGGERRVLGLPLDLNAATALELEALPGVGPTLATRIVDDRRARGPFSALDDLVRVRGIGPKKLRLLAGQAMVRAVKR